MYVPHTPPFLLSDFYYPSTPTPTPSPSTYPVPRITSFSGSLIHPLLLFSFSPTVPSWQEPLFLSFLRSLFLFLPSLLSFPSFLDSFRSPRILRTWNEYTFCPLSLWRNVLNSISPYSIRSHPPRVRFVSHPPWFPCSPLDVALMYYTFWWWWVRKERLSGWLGWSDGRAWCPEAKRKGVRS